MSTQWEEVANQRDLVCSLLGNGPDSRAFIGAGITLQDGAPNLLVYSQNDERTTKTAIKAKVGNGSAWVDTISVVRSQGFEPPGRIPPPRSPLAALRKHVQSLLERLQLKFAGLQVGDGTTVTGANAALYFGTIGCALQDSGGTPYYLTAGHVLPQPPNSFAYLNGGTNHSIGYVLASSTTDLDWSLIHADPQAATPVRTLQWDKGLTLTGPMSSNAVQGLPKNKVGISTQLYGYHVGTVLTIGTSLTVPRAASQIVVQSAPGDTFGIPGDSGAVAYLVSQLGNDPPGTAIGLYWYKDRQNDLHLLMPLADVLADIGQKAPTLPLPLTLL